MLVLLAGKLSKIHIEVEFNVATLVNAKQFFSYFGVNIDVDQIAAQFKQPDFVLLDLAQSHVGYLVPDVVIHVFIVDVEVPHVSVDSCTQYPDQIQVPKLRVRA